MHQLLRSQSVPNLTALKDKPQSVDDTIVDVYGKQQHRIDKIEANVIFTIERTAESDLPQPDTIKVPSPSTQDDLSELDKSYDNQTNVETTDKSPRTIPYATDLEDTAKETNNPTPDITEKTVVFCEMPIVPRKQPKGGADCNPLPQIAIDVIKTQLKTSRASGINCSMEEYITSALGTPGKPMISNYRANISAGTTVLSIISFGKGTYNAVFTNDIFTDCMDEKYILRISTKSIHRVDDAAKTIDFAYEIYYGLIAANKDIGPKIYKFGIMIDEKDANRLYFYSIIERIDGCDIKTFVSKTPNANADNNQSSYCVKATYPNDIVKKFKEIVDQSITKLTKTGDECGLLMMDTKPMNMMLSNDGNTVYVIDYDRKFVLEAKKPPSKMCGKINVLLFLSSLFMTIIHHIHTTNPKSAPFETTIHNQFGKYVIDKLNSEYYLNTDFNHIRKYIQDLYFKQPMFQNICHHYKYAETELMKIRYFTKYNLTVKQMFDIAGDTNVAFFLSNNTSNPMWITKDNSDQTNRNYVLEYIDMHSGNLETTTLAQDIPMWAYSINRLCVNNQDKSQCTTFASDKSHVYQRYLQDEVIPEYAIWVYRYFIHFYFMKKTEKQPALYNDMKKSFDEIMADNNRSNKEKMESIQSSMESMDPRLVSTVNNRIRKFEGVMLDLFDQTSQIQQKSTLFHTKLVDRAKTYKIIEDSSNPFLINDADIRSKQQDIISAFTIKNRLPISVSDQALATKR
jgi:hypothetical protein